MNAQEFVKKWARSDLGEKATYQTHFQDLCALVGHPPPDPSGTNESGLLFQFERAIKKTSGKQGYTDVYYEGHFAVEYKARGKYKDLNAAYDQLLQYRENLKNPPLLVVTDIENWEIHTNFPNTQKRVHQFKNADIAADETVLPVLQSLFHAPKSLNPRRHTEEVTAEAAEVFRLIADNMRQWQAQPAKIAHFLTKLVFCLFAEDVKLLPHLSENGQGIVSHIIQQSRAKPSRFPDYMQRLFRAMAEGGDFLLHSIDYFNGALFEDVAAAELSGEALTELAKAAKLNWDALEPSIFGTLFERSLDPRKRAQLGAHYTSRDDILLLIEPVLMQPLRAEWERIKRTALLVRTRHDKAKTGKTRTHARNELLELQAQMLARLQGITVLDPACGSGNFLYVALQLLMDMEKEVITHPLWTGLQRPLPAVHPRQMYGIEIDPIAHALASIVVWIGYIQWRISNGYGNTLKPQDKPILETLQGNIVCQDAILPDIDIDGTVHRPLWQETDIIVGNPPFLGGQRLRGELGDDYVERLRDYYEGEVPGGADLVCYWFERARRQLEQGKVKRVGLLATNSIRGGLNRQVLQRIKGTGDIFMAWSDRDWVLDGANVRISVVGFDDGSETQKVLDDLPAVHINPDLTADIDLTGVKALAENQSLSFQGVIKRGPFDIDAALALSMIKADPKNKAVLKPIANGKDITDRPRGKWIIDFGVGTPIEEARQYRLPFEYVETHVKPVRQKVKQAKPRENWWLYQRPCLGMRKALQGQRRYIATTRVAKHRLFVWLTRDILPDSRLYVFAREDDYFFGILHSKLHEVWSLRMCTYLGKGNDPRYTPKTTFLTFPFPYRPGSEDLDSPACRAIACAAARLHRERDAWLHPPQARASALRSRTLTNLYNALQVFRGQAKGKTPDAAGDFAPRLDELHRALDVAVCEAYGWDAALLDDDEAILRRLLALNLQRSRG